MDHLPAICWQHSVSLNSADDARAIQGMPHETTVTVDFSGATESESQLSAGVLVTTVSRR